MSEFVCCRDERREAVRAGCGTNGIDYLEVLDGPGVPDADRQRVLFVHLLDEPGPELLALTADQVAITGGSRITGIRVVDGSWSGRVLTVRVDRRGDFSTYTLHLRSAPGQPVPGIDARLSSIEFTFTVDCPAEYDCRPADRCTGPEPEPAPEIDYLTRDYAGFRRLMLDRLAALAPDLRERNPADLAVALVEVLAYVADQQSYRLDAVGMEATLATARRRVSARRHARLVDHRTHDGSNARTWVQLRAERGAAGTVVPSGTPLLTLLPRLAGAVIVPPGSPELAEALADVPTVFETMHDLRLEPDVNRMSFYTWGDQECALPVGATSATLVGHPPLHPGDVVVLVEARGPRNGVPADADPEHRQAVRLVSATPVEDPIGGRFLDPPTYAPVAVTEIVWQAEDALRFPLCLSARGTGGPVPDVSEALGNVVLADHGHTRTRERIATVPRADDRLTLPPVGGTRCEPSEPRPRPARFSLGVPEPDVTMVGTIGRALAGRDPREPARFDPSASAAAATRWDPRHVVPALGLSDSDGRTWTAVRDLLGSSAFSRDVVVEAEADGTATCRFGADGHGMRPREELTFDLTWRRGNGLAGNIGRGALAHAVWDGAGVEAVTNPLPGVGGTGPESIERTRRVAPAAFRVPERAVTADDYADLAGRHPAVQRAVATHRYTGSWYTVFLTVDRRGGLGVDAAFESELRAFLERFRLAGDDLEIDGPRFVALEVVLDVCVLPDYYRADVVQAVARRLGRGRSPDGRPAFFHPDNHTFGTPVTLSALLAAAQEVQGVRFVTPRTFRRQADARSDALTTGEITMGRLEIARLDDDPNAVDRGTLRLVPEGGR